MPAQPRFLQILPCGSGALMAQVVWSIALESNAIQEFNTLSGCGPIAYRQVWEISCKFFSFAAAVGDGHPSNPR